MDMERLAPDQMPRIRSFVCKAGANREDALKPWLTGKMAGTCGAARVAFAALGNSCRGEADANAAAAAIARGLEMASYARFSADCGRNARIPGFWSKTCYRFMEIAWNGHGSRRFDIFICAEHHCAAGFESEGRRFGRFDFR